MLSTTSLGCEEQKRMKENIYNEENNQQLQFPQLTIDDLYYLSFGPYQIRNAISYYAESKRGNFSGA